MKILFLVENPNFIEKYITENVPELKTISEREIVADTPYVSGFVKPGYSSFITNRAKNIVSAYRFNRPLAIILDKRHRDAVEVLSVDSAIKILNSPPRRLSESTGYKTDFTIKENDLSREFFTTLFSLDNSTES